MHHLNGRRRALHACPLTWPLSNETQAARSELHSLLDKPSLRGTPLLVLGNKNDKPGALQAKELIERLDLKVGFSPATDGKRWLERGVDWGKRADNGMASLRRWLFMLRKMLT